MLAHSIPSAPHLRSYGGPIQDHRHQALMVMLGPFETVGSIPYSIYWAHLIPLDSSNTGPIAYVCLQLLNGPTWALPRHTTLLHVGSTKHYI